MPPATDKEVHTLHRYLIWSIHMRNQCLQLNNIGNIPDDPAEKRLWLIRPFMWLALWLALLYVVAEGYENLRLSDPVIDEMLRSQNLDLLRRFRNGAFHFQRDYFDRRFTDVWSSEEVQDWAVKLHDEFRRFFSSGTKHGVSRSRSSKNQRSNQALQPTAPPGDVFTSILPSFILTTAKRRWRSGG